MIQPTEALDLSKEHVWRDLEKKLRPFVGRRVPPADVDDVIQDAFLRIQQGLASLREDERIGPWLYRVTRSAIVDHLRRSARHPPPVQAPERQDDEWNVQLHPAITSVEDDQGSVEREVASYAALFVATLPSPYREALTLTELEGLTQKEAAEILGISLSGMKSRVQRGRQKVRAALEACCNIAIDSRCRVVGCVPRPDGKVPDGCCS